MPHPKMWKCRFAGRVRLRRFDIDSTELMFCTVQTTPVMCIMSSLRGRDLVSLTSRNGTQLGNFEIEKSQVELT